MGAGGAGEGSGERRDAAVAGGLFSSQKSGGAVSDRKNGAGKVNRDYREVKHKT